ncbi:LysR family transcriptional regulator [Peribacillus alkalitolerans]|uniref:LysR family transcriptional regulator n=1 Tax=Peribacillus alkalitolerans TaxID=1550385 RepID=UPI0013D690F0|nr:LysR family transcriptional regulator [Peribacillus alkalitolerans]
MHIQKLKILSEVANTGSFSLAGQNLHISQSGISQDIKKIEDELGVKIFDRSRYGVVQTYEGTNIVKKANEVLQKYEELIEEARKILDIHSGNLRVSTIPAFITYLLKPLMEFKNLYSNITIEISENITELTVESVQQNKTEIGLICIYEDIIKEIEHLNFESILVGTLKVYVSSDSPFAKKKKIIPEEIIQQPVVLYNGDYIKWFINNFQHTFGKLNILFSSNQTEELSRLISNGSAIGFAPDFATKSNPYVIEGKMIEIDIINYEPINVTLGIIHSKNRAPSKIEKHLIQFIKSELQYYIS